MTRKESESITLIGEEIQGGNTGLYEFEFNESALISEVNIHNYLNQNFELRYYLYLFPDDSGNVIPLIEDISGTEFVAGDDDDRTFPMSIPVEDGDRVQVEVENIGTETLTTSLNIKIGDR